MHNTVTTRPVLDMDACAAVVQCKALCSAPACSMFILTSLPSCRVEWQARGPLHVHVLVTFGTMHPCTSFSIMDVEYDDNYDDNNDAQ